MYLMKLENNEKFAFLKLAYYMANIDGELDLEEINVIEEYCAEMGLEDVEIDLNDFDLDKVLKEIKTPKSQKIALLELMILVHSDDKFHKFENKVISDIARFYNIPQHTIDTYSQWGKMASALFLQGELFIEEEIN